MTFKPRIARIIGSTRPRRFADKPVQWMLKQIQARQDIDVEVVDLRDHPLPFFADMASTLHVPSKDPLAVRWQQTINRYDGHILVLAGYNYSMTGAPKNALDQAHEEWNWKTIHRDRIRQCGRRTCDRTARHRCRIALGLYAQRCPHRRQRCDGCIAHGWQQAHRGYRGRDIALGHRCPRSLVLVGQGHDGDARDGGLVSLQSAPEDMS